MNEIKIFAYNKKELETLIQAIRIEKGAGFQSDPHVA